MLFSQGINYRRNFRESWCPITKFMKEVFEEEFKKKEVNITKIISSNFTLTKKQQKSLKQEVNDLKESIEFNRKMALKKKLLMWRKKCPHLKSR